MSLSDADRQQLFSAMQSSIDFALRLRRDSPALVEEVAHDKAVRKRLATYAAERETHAKPVAKYDSRIS